MNDIKSDLQNNLTEALKSLGIKDVEIEIERPKDESHGDFSSNVSMKLSAVLKKNPLQIAQELVTELDKNKLESIEKIEAVNPGFINFYIKKSAYLNILENVISLSDKFGANNIGEGKNVIVEFSSPNIAKPFTIGHLRSTIIGDSIAKILEFSGYKVFRDNHLGDWGASFGKYLAAFEHYNIDIEEIKKSDRPIKQLVDLYIKFTQDSEENPDLKELGREWFKKLEDGDEKARKLWQECINISFIEFDKVYKKLNVSFTENEGKGYGESFFEDKMPAVIKELEEANEQKRVDYHKSEGAMLVFFPKEELPPMMVLKSNGTTLYSTRDLATDKYRKENSRYGYPNLTVINETGIEQSLYWKQIFKTEEMLGWYKKGERIAIMHGLYRFKEGKMSTRKGNVIWLEDVLNESINRAEKLSKEEEAELPVKIGVGAIKWNDLKRDPKQDIVFDWEEILNLKGNSSPYIQYTYVRANKIGKTNNFDFNDITPNEEEGKVLDLISQFGQIIEYSAQNYQSSTICTYLFNLSQSYSTFYEKHRILNAEDEKTKNFRIALSQATAQVIKNGLNLLGIETVERM